MEDDNNIDVLWDNVRQQGEDVWYQKSLAYWKTQDATVDGVLAGHGAVSPVDLEASLKFLEKIKYLPEGRGGTCEWGRALDCGAGIGRVTKGVLLKVDLLEPVAHLLSQAEKILVEHQNVENFFLTSLQNFTPADQLYDCIWLQWCVLYLTDYDLVALLRRFADRIRPHENVILKASDFHLDRTDNSLMRYGLQRLEHSLLDNASTADMHYRKLFKEAGLSLVLEMRQPKFPKVRDQYL